MNDRSSPLAGWGNYPTAVGTVYRPDRIAAAASVARSAPAASLLPRGLGRSYGDNALNEDAGLLLGTAFDRFLDFDPDAGVLTCEGGVSFDEILRVFVPRGWFLPVTPGTKYVTVGGAIANDVHGKNHHRDGTISRHVTEITLLIADGSLISCTRTRHPDLFWATIGGIGLTGLIVTATIRLQRIANSYIDVDYRKASHIMEALELFDKTDDQYRYSVAWIDCLAKGRSLGRSVLMRGNHAAPDRIKPGISPLSLNDRMKLTVPFSLPSFCLSKTSIKLFNETYYAVHRNGQSSLTHYEPYFYPLDAIHHWNRMYGRRGFVQYQFVLPPETAAEGLVKVLELFSSMGVASFLAVLKRFGDQSEGMLSFPTKGYTLALDIPLRDPSLISFLHRVDDLVLAYGGRIYLAKDAIMRDNTFSRMYPRLPEFREAIARWDPHGRWSSSQARRLGIRKGEST